MDVSKQENYRAESRRRIHNIIFLAYKLTSRRNNHKETRAFRGDKGWIGGRRKSKFWLIDRANTISWIPSVSVDDRKEEICAGFREGSLALPVDTMQQ